VGGGSLYNAGQDILLKNTYFPFNDNLPLFEWDDDLQNKTIRVLYGTGGDTHQKDLTLSSFPITTKTGYNTWGEVGGFAEDFMQFNLNNNLVYLIQRSHTGQDDYDYSDVQEVHIGIYKITLLN
jgi:hypothetical protein